MWILTFSNFDFRFKFPTTLMFNTILVLVGFDFKFKSRYIRGLMDLGCFER
jgi:hypothetical protein